MKYEIKNRFTGTTIYQDEAESFSALILAAIKAKISLQSADLRSANLQSANLRSAKNISAITNAQTLIVPESGAFEGWKICRDKVLVRVLIPKDAARSNATGRKCRAEKVKVLEVIGAKEGVSQHDEKVVYTKGKVVKCHEWSADRWLECGGGIHFFITRAEAEAY